MRKVPSRLAQRAATHGNIHSTSLRTRRTHFGQPLCISKFPNEEFRNGKLRDGPQVNVKWACVMAGLTKVLYGIVAKTFRHPDDAQDCISRATNEQAHHHHSEVLRMGGGSWGLGLKTRDRPSRRLFRTPLPRSAGVIRREDEGGLDTLVSQNTAMSSSVRLIWYLAAWRMQEEIRSTTEGAETPRFLLSDRGPAARV